MTQYIVALTIILKKNYVLFLNYQYKFLVINVHNQ